MRQPKTPHDKEVNLMGAPSTGNNQWQNLPPAGPLPTPTQPSNPYGPAFGAPGTIPMFGGAGPRPGADNANVPFQASNSGPLKPGDVHPWNNPANTNVNNGLIAPPPLPSNEFTSRFIPPILLNPFVGAINAATQMGSWAAQAAPMASGFQQGLYAPGLNPMEAAFMGSGAELGLRGLESAFNRAEAQYENTPFASTLHRQQTDAANQFAEQMANVASQLGIQRERIATQNLPVAFGFPLQAGQAAQQAASGLLGLAQQAMIGEMGFPLSAYSLYPVAPPAIIQPAPQQGGKK